MPKIPDSLQRANCNCFGRASLNKRIKHLVKMTEINSKIADLSTGFTVSLGSSVSLDEEGESSGELSIKASGPIFSGGKLYSSSRKAIASNEQTLARLYSAKISIEQNVSSAFSLLQVAKAAKKSAEEQIRATEVALKGVKEEAGLGARTTLDVFEC